jgi:hypothetical protein
LPSAFARLEAGLGALDQEVALKLGHSIDDVHGQLAGRAGQIDAAERQAMNPHPKLGELCHRGAHIHHIATEAIELGDDQHVAGFQPVE